MIKFPSDNIPWEDWVSFMDEKSDKDEWLAYIQDESNALPASTGQAGGNTTSVPHPPMAVEAPKQGYRMAERTASVREDAWGMDKKKHIVWFNPYHPDSCPLPEQTKRLQLYFKDKNKFICQYLNQTHMTHNWTSGYSMLQELQFNPELASASTDHPCRRGAYSRPRGALEAGARGRSQGPRVSIGPAAEQVYLSVM